jgi:hypothetical protein
VKAVNGDDGRWQLSISEPLAEDAGELPDPELVNGSQTDRSELPCGVRLVTGMSIKGTLGIALTGTQAVGGDPRGEGGRHNQLHDGCSSRTGWWGWGRGGVVGRGG